MKAADDFSLCIGIGIYTKFRGKLSNLFKFSLFKSLLHIFFLKCQQRDVPGAVAIVTVDTVTENICEECSFFLFQSHGLMLNLVENGCVLVVDLMNN